ELSFILFLVSLIVLSIHFRRLTFIEKKITWKHLILFVIFVIPYFEILNIRSILNPEITRTKGIIEMLSGDILTWHWWFLNHYIDADGVIVSFVGKNILLYYLYNGVLLLAVLIFGFVRLAKNKLKIGIYLLPPLLYFAYFFLVAEFFPRIGLAFLPTRAWIHLILPVVILLVLVVEIIEKNSLKIKFLPPVLIGLILIGYSGTLYVAKTNIKEIDRAELPGVKFIEHNLEPNALILSSQDNIDLVSVYANRDKYIQIPVTSTLDISSFKQLVKATLLKASKDQIIPIQDQIIQTLEFYQNHTLVDKQISVIQDEKDQIIKAENSDNNPVYFLFSYHKLDALNTANQDRQTSADLLNRNVYAHLGYPIVYDDSKVLIIKIR
ncbi:hypothetical protein KGQ71_03810, partial [Patescibacteria group bacterium]|nr:hypothetical protein [Patescibacteria group bacterium]